MGDVLPAGALEALKEGGTAAFDRAIEADRQATQQALTTARNIYNDSKRATPSQAERDAVRMAHIERGLRENPGRTRAEVEAAYDAEAKAAREKWDEAQKKRQADSAPLRGQMFDTSQMAPEDVIALAGIERPVMPSQFELDNDVLGTFAGFALEENIPTPIANDLVTWWSDVVLGAAGGDIDWDEAERVFNETFSDLTDRQRAALAAWMRQIHGVGDGQEDGEGA
jgi:hypothetical protein